MQTHSAHSCYEWCLGDERCSFWVFCHSRSGCDDSGVFDGRFPYESCTLMRHPQACHCPLDCTANLGMQRESNDAADMPACPCFCPILIMLAWYASSAACSYDSGLSEHRLIFSRTSSV